MLIQCTILVIPSPKEFLLKVCLLLGKRNVARLETSKRNTAEQMRKYGQRRFYTEKMKYGKPKILLIENKIMSNEIYFFFTKNHVKILEVI